jgi:hypothetical protein
MASDENENEILTALARVLEPLGAERQGEVLEWAKEHLAECPIFTYLCATGEAGDVDTVGHAKVYEYKIGEPHPLDESNTVFAILHWHTQGVFVVYSFKAVFLETGAAAGTFTRDLVFQPRFAQGPLTLEALYSDLEYHLKATPWDDVEDPAPPPVLVAQRSGGRS